MRVERGDNVLGENCFFGECFVSKGAIAGKPAMALCQTT